MSIQGRTLHLICPEAWVTKKRSFIILKPEQSFLLIQTFWVIFRQRVRKWTKKNYFGWISNRETGLLENHEFWASRRIYEDATTISITSVCRITLSIMVVWIMTLSIRTFTAMSVCVKTLSSVVICTMTVWIKTIFSLAQHGAYWHSPQWHSA